jgi:hypothetical protein
MKREGFKILDLSGKTAVVTGVANHVHGKTVHVNGGQVIVD